MAYITSIPEMVQKILNLISDNAAALGLQGVYYGDEDLIPKFPAVSVQGGRKNRTIATTRQFEVALTVQINIYFGKVQSSEINTKETEELAEAIEDLLHTNKTMDGSVVFGYVSRTDPGTARAPNGVMIKTSRMFWEGRAREMF